MKARASVVLAGLLPLLLAVALPQTLRAQAVPYLLPGLEFSLFGDAAGLGARPALTIGTHVGRGEYDVRWAEGRLAVEVGVSYEFLRSDGYKVFLLDEINAATFAPRDAVTERAAFRSRYHVFDITPRVVVPLTENFAVLGGAHVVIPVLGYRDESDSQSWTRAEVSPWQFTYGLRIETRFFFLDWSGYWSPDFLGSDEYWDMWFDTHNHGLRIGARLQR